LLSDVTVSMAALLTVGMDVEEILRQAGAGRGLVLAVSP
jgi:hypothetical protein